MTTWGAGMKVLTIESTGRRDGDLMAGAESVEARVRTLELEGFERRHFEVRCHVVRIPDVEPEGSNDSE